MALNAVAVVLWLFLAGAIWDRLRDAGEEVMAANFALGVGSFVTLLLAGFAAFGLLIYRAEPGDARLLYDLAFGLLAISGAPTALALGAYAIGVARWRVLPLWTTWLAIIGAVAHLVLIASLSVRGSGFLSLEGAGIIVVPATLFAWILASRSS
jgi:hypothetical protein